MPFPFAMLGPIGTAIASFLGLTAPAIAIGPILLATAGVVLGGLTITAAIVEANEKARKKAREEARARASKEHEEELLKQKAAFVKELEDIKAQYDSNISNSKKEELLLRASHLEGSLQGNIEGLERAGKTASKEAKDAMKRLREMREKCGLKK